MFGDIYRGRNVLVTGHTGFKGSWLCEWLLLLGAKVTGYALAPPTEPGLFDAMKLGDRVDDRRGDIADAEKIAALVKHLQPEVIFHMAAQPLVRDSYERPVETFSANVMGTVSLLDAVRRSGHACSVVVITTDKCYHNREWVHGYREEDRLGGHDPYSASKACAELAVACYQKSFGESHNVRVCSARAGNVIGGGDWAAYRIVPDSMKALARGEAIVVRNPAQTRPWQHVLEPLSGYMWLGALLHKPDLLGADDMRFRSAFNFGPQLEANRPVRDLVEEILKHWPGEWRHEKQVGAPHEAGLLSLTIDKVWHQLRWRPAWDFASAVAETATWYRRHHEGAGAAGLVREQIARYAADAAALGVAWAAEAA
jgi:CDP-glucose 4,6-dehydratase